MEKWKVLERPSKSPDLNPNENAFDLDVKRELKGETPQNKLQLKEAVKPGKEYQKKKARVWQCQSVTGLMQLLQTKD